MSFDPTSIGEGDKIDKYVVDRKLGQGGMGAVYQAHHEVTFNQVAIKLLLATTGSNPELEMRFKREAAAANQIGHPGFVRALDFGDFHERPYIVMEFLSGETLGELCRRPPPSALGRVVRLLLQVTDALEAAHRRGIIHRDLKPENIFVLPGDIVKVLDLGIAKFLNDYDALKTQTSALLGSPSTMSPEQCRGARIDHRSDIYSLGVVAYYLSSGGQYPFIAEYPGEILAAHVRDEPPPLAATASWLPLAFTSVIHRTLQKKPEERFQTMEEFGQALAPFRDSTVGPMSPAGSDQRTQMMMTPSSLDPLPPATPANTVISGAGVLHAVTGERSMASGEVQPSAAPLATRSGRSRAPAAMGAALALVLAGGGAWLALRRAPAPAAAPSQPAAAPSQPAAAPSQPAAAPSLRAAQAPAATPPVQRAATAPAEIAAAPLPPPARPAPPAPARPATPPPARPVPAPPRAAATPPQAAGAPPAAHAKSDRAYLSVYVLPFAEVTIDGKGVGETPIHDFAVKPGLHTVELSNAGMGKSEKRSVKIDPGQHARIRAQWAP